VAIAVGGLAIMLAVALTATYLAPYVFTAPDPRNRLAPPGNPLHWLGTDELGRYVLSRLIISVRVSLPPDQIADIEKNAAPDLRTAFPKTPVA
jgi:peptide/nickel transport system permease protein